MRIERTRRGRTPIVVSALLAASVAAGQARQQAPAPAPRSSQDVTTQVREGVRAVLVDVVVRDRRGQPVRDLTPADFEVTEDGAAQTIGSFTKVFDGEGSVVAPPDPAAPAAPASPAPPGGVGAGTTIKPGPPIIALVFDRLSPEARRLAVKSAEAYIGKEAQASGYIGIYSIDLGLTPYAPFTRSAYTLRQALQTLESRASASFNNAEQQAQRRDASQRAASSQQATATATAGGGQGTSGAVGTAPGAAQLAAMQSQMLSDFELMERDQQGYSTTNGLSAIVAGLRQLPGRKSLVLFSEGISIPPAVQRLFIGVIDAANRANVSIYTMDAAGLRAESEQAKIRDQVNAAGNAALSTGHSVDSGSEPLSKALENNEYVLRQDPHTGLGSLAQETGGLEFQSSNDLRQNFDRIESDLRNYYLVGYTPSNDNFDGKFRAIDVKVRRPGLTVSARKGYFAVKDTGGLPVNEWEAPALAAFDQKRVPNAFAFRASALSFPQSARLGLVPVVVDLPTAPLTFRPAEDGKTYASDFAIVVRFMDAQGMMARKVSQHYEVNGPVEELERAKQGRVTFYREPDLPPGLYSMETIVYDNLSGKASVRLANIEIPKMDPAKLRLSSLVIVRQAEKVPEKERRADNPLLVGDAIVYPNLGDPVSKQSKELGFFFTVYTAKGGPTPEAVLEIATNGKAIAQLPLQLGAPDSTGRIQEVGRLPLEALAPGTYELRAAVKQGSDQIVKSALVRIVE